MARTMWGDTVPQGVSIKAVEILKPGTYWDANGNKVPVSLADLEELAAEYDPALLSSPVVVGHPKMADPAYGWMERFYLGKTDKGEDVLLADLHEVEAEFAENAIKPQRYKNRSLAFFGRTSKGNPKPGKLYPKHLGLLGAKAPAVKGLKPIALAADDESIVIELGAPSWRLSGAFRTVADVLRRWRESIIEEKGVEAADEMISAWQIEDLQAAASDIDAAALAEEPAPHFANPERTEPVMTPQELAAKEATLNQRQAEIDAREKKIGEQEVALAAAETSRRKQDDSLFVDGLIKEGKLRPTEKGDVLAELAALDDGDPTIELAAGDDGKSVKLNPRQAYRRRLAAASPLVELGKHAKGVTASDADIVEFAAPAGVEVEAGNLEIHRKALAHQAAHPGTEYMAAVKAVGGR